MIDPEVKYVVGRKIRFRDKDGHRQEFQPGTIVSFELGDRIDPDILNRAGTISIYVEPLEESPVEPVVEKRGGGGHGRGTRKGQQSLHSKL